MFFRPHGYHLGKGDDSMKFNKKLIALRHAKGISQQQLGEAIKVTPEIIHGWEVGLAMPDLDQLTRLADFFGLPLDIFIKGIDTHSTPVIHLEDVEHHVPADNERGRVITQLEILCGSVASVTILGTIVYLLAGFF